MYRIGDQIRIEPGVGSDIDPHLSRRKTGFMGGPPPSRVGQNHTRWLPVIHAYDVSEVYQYRQPYVIDWDQVLVKITAQSGKIRQVFCSLHDGVAVGNTVAPQYAEMIRTFFWQPLYYTIISTEKCSLFHIYGYDQPQMLLW